MKVEVNSKMDKENRQQYTCDLSEDTTSGSNEEEEEYIETHIEISIQSIENIVREDNFLIKFELEHGETKLGESGLITIYASYESLAKIHPINFGAELPYSASNMKTIAPIVSTPVLIKVFEITEDNSSINKNGTNSKRPSNVDLKLIGLCNVDLMPVLLGEEVCDDKLVLEASSYSWGSTAVSWTNLPRISISMRPSESGILRDSDINFLNITIESIYNLPTYFTQDLEYKCGTVLNTDTDDIEDSCIIFDAGKWTDFHDVEWMKTWKSLQNLDSRARFSKYKISCDYDCVKNCFKKQFDLKAAVKQNVERIEWNTTYRTLLEEKDIQNIQDRLKKYKLWPFEIMVAEEEKEPQNKDIQEQTAFIYQCYADISQLLFPGRTKARVLAQLYTRSSSEMEENTGLSMSIFGNKTVYDPGVRKSKVSEDFLMGETDLEEGEPSFPVFTENGDPVLVLIEFELYRPFLPARVFECYTDAMDALKSKPKPKGPLYTYTPDLVYDQYINCIKQLVEVIGESYRDFSEQCDCPETDSSSTSSKQAETIRNPCKPPDVASNNVDITCPYFYIQDELSRFKQFLHESGKYVSIRSTLKTKIINLLDQKFAMNSSEWFSTENQNFVSSCYTYLVEEMHVALNKTLQVRLAEKYPQIENPEKLWFRAEEAYECGDVEKTDKLVTKIISDDRGNADSWVIYAIHHMKACNIDEATECSRQAIRLNSRHKIALLFYGVILAMREEYTDAEIFLKAVTFFYPRFAEGWAILHLLYVKMQYYPGIDLTLSIAEKCLMDRIREDESMDIIKMEPIAWSTMLRRNNRIFLLTAVLLLKMNLFSFADLALSQELCQGERSTEFLYFLAVNHYLQGSYEVALDYLKEAESIVGMDYSIASLMGHSCHKVGKIEEAVEQFEAADRLYDRPENIHLVHLRMGFYYIDIHEYERARCTFLRVCRQSPTCKTWLGVGMSSYYLEMFEESELALMEANKIDCEDPEVWGYLCLLSMSLHRYDEFTQCYRMAVKNNLRSDKLWRLITHSMDTLGYSSPIVFLEYANDRCIC